eukprot:765768-Pelagomonas_calceolata.AAC.8
MGLRSLMRSEADKKYIRKYDTLAMCAAAGHPAAFTQLRSPVQPCFQTDVHIYSNVVLKESVDTHTPAKDLCSLYAFQAYLITAHP